jgi:hypothetical protein
MFCNASAIAGQERLRLKEQLDIAVSSLPVPGTCTKYVQVLALTTVPGRYWYSTTSTVSAVWASKDDLRILVQVLTLYVGISVRIRSINKSSRSYLFSVSFVDRT